MKLKQVVVGVTIIDSKLNNMSRLDYKIELRNNIL